MPESAGIALIAQNSGEAAEVWDKSRRMNQLENISMAGTYEVLLEATVVFHGIMPHALPNDAVVI